MNTLFSVYPQGYWNEKKQQWVLATKPFGAWTKEQAYEYIISEAAKSDTDALQRCYTEYLQRKPSMSETEAKHAYDMMSDFKKKHFIIATFAGLFSYRNVKSLTLRSPYMPLYFDDLEGEEEARDLQQRLMSDKYIEVALSFLSPKGRGLKAIAVLPEWTEGKSYLEQYRQMQHYMNFHYGYAIDNSGKDLGRACFLPHDPHCMISQTL